MLATPTTTPWAFPPSTREVQLDEKWDSVGKKPARCDPEGVADGHEGDHRDHVAFDPEHRLVLAVVPGARSMENAEAIVEEAKRRADPRVPLLITGDGHPAYRTAIEHAFGEPVPAEKGPGRPRIMPELRAPERVVYATVHRERGGRRVVSAERRLVLGTEASLLERSVVSTTVNTSFLERQNGAGRDRNARKVRRPSRLSEECRVHEARTYLTMYGDNSCWSVRTLRQREEGGHQHRALRLRAPPHGRQTREGLSPAERGDLGRMCECSPESAVLRRFADRVDA